MLSYLHLLSHRMNYQPYEIWKSETRSTSRHKDIREKPYKNTYCHLWPMFDPHIIYSFQQISDNRKYTQTFIRHTHKIKNNELFTKSPLSLLRANHAESLLNRILYIIVNITGGLQGVKFLIYWQQLATQWSDPFITSSIDNREF